MARRHKHDQKQQGFLLFELVVILMIASLLAAWSADRWVNDIEDHAAASSGAWLVLVGNAVRQELKLRADALQTSRLKGAAALAEFRTHRVKKLEVSKLIEAGHLPGSFVTKPSLPYQLEIYIRQVVRANCVNAACALEALLVLRPDGTESENAQDSNRLGKLLTTLAGTGLVVHPLAISRLKGAPLDLPNPPWETIPTLPVGTVALHFSHPISLSPQDRFGGAFVSAAGANCKGLNSPDQYVNPLTGDCNCPEGYLARLVAEWRIDPPYEHSFHATGVRAYVCVAPL